MVETKDHVSQMNSEKDPQHQKDAPQSGAKTPAIKAEVKDLKFFYGTNQVLRGINVGIEENHVTALIGPSGCGKTTLLRCFNRMHDLYPNNHYDGQIILNPEGFNLIDPRVDPIEVRMRINMVFQKPNPFPKSIFENVIYGLRVQNINKKSLLEERVEEALKGAALWEEVKDRLHSNAFDLSGGQQQRLCIARALATDPEIILFDEPTSAVDPIGTAKIEELIGELKKKVTIIIVTHNMQQAARVSDKTGFMYLGELLEFDNTEKIFTNPSHEKTHQYVTGRFG